MAFRIETRKRGRFTVFILSGRIESQTIDELRRLFDLQTNYRNIILNLKDARLVDREAMSFLGDWEAAGMTLENCPSYIREWMQREKDCF